MAFNGSGLFNRIHDWTDDAAAAVKINASRMDAEMDGMATGLSTCITKDGQTTITANLPMATFKHTGVGASAARTDYARVAEMVDGTHSHATSGGSANAYTLTLSPAITAYVAGQSFEFLANHANTGATTLAVSGLAAKAIQLGTTALAGGEIPINSIARVTYDGTQFQLASNVAFARAQTWTAAQTFSSGIIFANETLSTYDEGTWTPGVSFGGGTTGITYALQSGNYIKIGKSVSVWGEAELSAKGSSTGNARVTGLPFTRFTNANIDNFLTTLATRLDLNVAGGYYSALAGVESNTTTALLYEQGDNVALTALTEADFANNSRPGVSGVYYSA